MQLKKQNPKQFLILKNLSSCSDKCISPPMLQNISFIGLPIFTNLSLILKVGSWVFSGERRFVKHINDVISFFLNGKLKKSKYNLYY